MFFPTLWFATAKTRGTRFGRLVLDQSREKEHVYPTHIEPAGGNLRSIYYLNVCFKLLSEETAIRNYDIDLCQ